jgi:hypothetical protein
MTEQPAEARRGDALGSTELRDALLRQFEIAWSLASFHLETLTTEECLWRPAAQGLHVHPQDGVFHADWPEHERYDLGPSSIAWLTWHMIFWWSSVLDHHFGAGTLTRQDVLWPGSADTVRTRIGSLAQDWREHLRRLDDDALRATERTRWPFQGAPFGDVVAWLNVELAKNAAEIGFARFLYAARG